MKIKKITYNEKFKYIKPKKVYAERDDGREVIWECIDGFDSVHIGVYNEDTEEFLFVKQKRIPVILNDENNEYVIECCAGICDKDIPIIEIAKEEVQEELGYKVKEIELIANIKSDVGRSGNDTYLFIAIVNEGLKIDEGGGLEDEDIEVIRIKNLKKFKKSLLFPSNICTDSTTLYIISELERIESELKR